MLRSMRRRASEIERVRNSIRHTHLAIFVWQAAKALEADEWEGARYLLMTAYALMTIRPVIGNEVAQAGKIYQFPGAAEIGIVTG